MKPPLQAKPIGTFLELILRRWVQSADPAARDALREFHRAVRSRDSGRVDQVLDGMARRAQAKARAAGKGGRKR